MLLTRFTRVTSAHTGQVRGRENGTLKVSSARSESPVRANYRPNGSDALKEILTPRDKDGMNTFLSTKIELWPVEKLIPYDQNARTHSGEQIEQITCSIQEFGFTNPILVDTGAGILAGHARLRGARQAGLLQVPVIVLDHLCLDQPLSGLCGTVLFTRRGAFFSSLHRPHFGGWLFLAFRVP